MPQMAEQSITMPFEQEAQQAIEELRAAIADVIGSCSEFLQRPSDLTRTLGIDKSLASKLMRSIEADDAFAAAQLLPGPSGINILLNAAEKCGASKAAVSRAAESLLRYEAFIRRHGGDRRTFLRMLGSLVPEDSAASSIEATHRKAAFEANSFLWGVKVRTHLNIGIVRPSDDGESVDIALIAAFINLVRLRRDTPWIISRTAYVSDEGNVQPGMNRESIDPAAAEHEAPLMTEFCSKPMPKITRRPVPGNFMETTLVSGPIGETAATTVTTGEVFRKVAPRYRSKSKENATFYMRLRTPAEHMVNLMLVQRSEFADAPPRFGVYSELDAIVHHPVNLDSLKTLTNDTSIQHLGNADSAIMWPREAPRLGTLLKRSCEHLGWNLGDFDVYCARQPYPILSSVAITAFEMRDKP